MSGSTHEETVEVQGGGLVVQQVEHVNDEPVANVDADGGNRPLPVDADGWTVCHAVGVGRDPGDVEVVRDRGRARE